MEIKNISQNLVVIAGVKIYPGNIVTEADFSDDFVFDDYSSEIQQYIDDNVITITLNGNEIDDVNDISDVFANSGNSGNSGNLKVLKDFYYNYKTIHMDYNQEIIIPFQGFLKTLNVYCASGDIEVQIVEPLMNKIEINEASNYEIDADYKLQNPKIKIISKMSSSVEIYMDGIFQDDTKTKEQYLREIYSDSTFPSTSIIDTNKLQFKANFKKIIQNNIVRDIVNNAVGKIYYRTSLINFNKFEDGAFVSFNNAIPFYRDTPFTFNIWFKSYEDTTDLQYIYNRDNFLDIYIKSNKIYARLLNCTYTIGEISKNQFYMFSVSYENSRINFYINDENVLTVNRYLKFCSSHRWDNFGGHSSAYTMRSGEIGEVNFWSYSLSKGLIRYLYSNNNPDFQFKQDLVSGCVINTYTNTSSLSLDTVYNAEIINKEVARVDNLISSTVSSTSSYNVDDNLLKIVRGFIRFKNDDQYRFSANEDKSVIFLIDGKTVLENETQNTSYIEEGYYPFVVYSTGKFNITVKTKDTSAVNIDVYKNDETNGIFMNLDNRTGTVTFDDKVQDLHFHDSNFTKVTSLPSDFFSQKFTFSLDITSNTEYADIFSQGTFWDEYIRLYMDDRKLVLTFNDIVIRSNRITLNQKVHVDIVANGVKIFLYIDGILYQSKQFYSNKINSKPMYFGVGAEENITNWLVGDFTLKNVKINKHVLSEDQIVHNYQNS